MKLKNIGLTLLVGSVYPAKLFVDNIVITNPKYYFIIAVLTLIITAIMILKSEKLNLLLFKKIPKSDELKRIIIVKKLFLIITYLMCWHQ